ncbi:MAG: YceD family protein [Xanthobacteraceae bacterium]
MAHPAQSPAADPWPWPVNVDQIPEAGLQVAFEATETQCAALATVAGLRDLVRAAAAFELSHAGGGKVHVTGQVTARVGQTCVVTLDPVENDIDESVDLMFAPEADIPRLSSTVDDEVESEDIPDSPEPIINGVIDLGRVATDVLFLGIDPYPRKPDAVFEQPAVPADPEDHPFAALKALKKGKAPPDSD